MHSTSLGHASDWSPSSMVDTWRTLLILNCLHQFSHHNPKRGYRRSLMNRLLQLLPPINLVVVKSSPSLRGSIWSLIIARESLHKVISWMLLLMMLEIWSVSHLFIHILLCTSSLAEFIVILFNIDMVVSYF